MAPVRIGFIGLSTTGWASGALATPLLDPLLSSSYTLTALCTTLEATSAAAAKKYSELARRPIRGYYGEEGVQAIANDPEVDLVAVSVKTPDHYKAVMPAIEAGKDVFVEWPVGNGYEEAVKIAEAAKRKGVRMLVGAQGIQSSSMKKVKELVESGKIGRVLSTTATFAVASEGHYFGKTITSRSAYSLDANNGKGQSPYNPLGHFLSVLTHTLGDFAQLSATGAIQFGSATFVDEDGNLTAETIKKTVHDQIALSGILRDPDNSPGAFVNVHVRAGLPGQGEHGRGRTLFKWIIDGELGTIEIQNKPERGIYGAFISMGEMRVLFNGEEVAWEASDADRLGNSGKAWLEFAKGKEGKYWGINDSLELHRVLDAALTSIDEGRRKSL